MMKYKFPLEFSFLLTCNMQNYPVIAKSWQRNVGRTLAAGLIGWFSISVGQAQQFTFAFSDSIPVVRQADTLHNAWAGGLNAGQYSTIDLNNDATDDLVIFDRAGNKLTTFLAVPAGNSFRYQHAPQYALQFPAITSWMLLADYNGDGKKDIFAHTAQGVKVYRNATENGNLSWQLMTDPLETQGFSGQINLLVPSGDIPAITDVEPDGDLDLLTFDLVGGNVELHQNLSVETYGHADSLLFKKISACWGQFYESSTCGDFLFNIDCEDNAGGRRANARVQHTGSAMLLLDLNGDQQKDLLLADVSCNNLYRMTNRGTTTDAVFTDVDASFPENNPVDLFTFPAVFYEDLNFDGKKDLLAAPNLPANEADRVNFRQSNWLYENTGTEALPVFSYRQNDFLQHTMIDLGENTVPAFADYDADGDLDVFIGNRGNLENGTFYATLTLYENIGNATQAAFSWVTDDYLNLASQRLVGLKPAFIDVTGDGALELVFTATRPDRTTELYYLPNTAPRNQPFAFAVANSRTLPILLNAGDSPLLYDVDNDNDLDLLVGKPAGNLVFYRNTGSVSSPAFTLDQDAFSGIEPEATERNLTLTIADIDQDGKPDLVTSGRTGTLRAYPDVLETGNQPSVPVTELIISHLEQRLAAVTLGGNVYPTLIDLNGDGLPELVAGTQGGGVVLLKNRTQSGGFIPEPDEPANLLYPNPVTDGYLYVNVAADSEVEIFNTAGQRVMGRQPVLANVKTPVDVRPLRQGLYLVKITAGSKITVYRLVVVPEK